MGITPELNILLTNAVNKAVLHLPLPTVEKCVHFLSQNPKCIIMAEKGYNNGIKNKIREFLKLDTLPRGTSTLSRSFWLLRGWTEDETDFKIKQQTSKRDYAQLSPFSKSNSKYDNLSDEEISKIIKSKRPNSKEFYLARGFSAADAETKVRDFQNAANLKANLDYKSDRNPTQFDYWIKMGHADEGARQKIRERQAVFSVKSFINRLGLFRGVLKHLCYAKDRNKPSRRAKVKALWKCREIKTRSEEVFFQYLDIFNKSEHSNRRGHGSLESLLFFLPFNDILDKTFTCHLGIHRGKKEFRLKNKNRSYFRYDFCIEELKIIYEYNGIYWHGPKNKFVNQLLRQEKIEEKIKLAEENGFTVIELDGLSSLKDFKTGIKNFETIKSSLNEKGIKIDLSTIQHRFLQQCLIYDKKNRI